jgi:hypothetical protein
MTCTWHLRAQGNVPKASGDFQRAIHSAIYHTAARFLDPLPFTYRKGLMILVTANHRKLQLELRVAENRNYLSEQLGFTEGQ